MAKYRYWIRKKSNKYRPRETTVIRNISPIPAFVARRVVKTTTTTTTTTTSTTTTTTTTTTTEATITTATFEHEFGCSTKINACRKSRTINGFECQRWDVLYPHEPNPDVLSNLLRSDHNYCAPALSTDPRPWCYTTNKFKKWDYCDCKPRRKNCQVQQSDLIHQRAPTPASPIIPARAMHIFGPPAPPIDLQSKCGLIASPINIFKGFIEPFTIFNESGDSIRNCETTKMCKSNLPRSKRVTGGFNEKWLRVVGGNNAKNKNFPWQMSLMGPRVCGGTLVAMNVSFTI